MQLKKGRTQPDASKAASVSMDVIDDYNRDRYNPVIADFVKKLPGVTSRNVYAILNAVNSMGELLAMSVDDLAALVGAGNGSMLHEALHKPQLPRGDGQEVAASAASATGAGKAKRGRFKSNVNGRGRGSGKIEIRD